MTQRSEMAGDGKNDPTPITYDLLTQEELDDRLVATMRAQQMSHWEYSANIERYDQILAEMPYDGEPGPDPKQWTFRQRVMAMRAADAQQRANVEVTLQASAQQMPDATRTQAALQRIQAREAAALSPRD